MHLIKCYFVRNPAGGSQGICIYFNTSLSELAWISAASPEHWADGNLQYRKRYRKRYRMRYYTEINITSDIVSDTDSAKNEFRASLISKSIRDVGVPVLH